MKLRIFLASLGLAFASSAWASEECSVLTATGNAEYPPFLWRSNETGAPLTGANKFILDEIGNRLGKTIQLKDVGSWAKAQDTLRSGRVDLMAGAFFTEARKDYMDYIRPAFLETTSVVWMRNGHAFSMHSKDDLQGRSGVTVINNSFGQEFDEYAKKHLDVLYVPSLKQMFSMLARGRVDYALYEQNPGFAYANDLGFQGILLSGQSISTEGLFLTISKKSNCNTEKLQQELATVIQDMQEEGFMQTALDMGFERWQKR